MMNFTAREPNRISSVAVSRVSSLDFRPLCLSVC